MHRQVSTSVKQRRFQLFDEKTFATYLGQCAIQDLVATGGEGKKFDFARRIQRAKDGLNMFGLPQREPARTRGNDQSLRLGHGHHQSDELTGDDRDHHADNSQ